MASIGVIHLVWAPVGLESFRTFLKSYADSPAGVEHDLIVAFKGFDSERSAMDYRSLLSGVRHSCLFIPRSGFDIRSYYHVVETCRYDFYCPLNSRSVILDGEWLAKLYGAAREMGIGLAGASGSGLSWRSHLLETRHALKHRAPYRGMTGRLRLMARAGFYAACFDPFPNYHVRTTAFMMRRDLFVGLRRSWMSTKAGTYLFESGKRSMTKQIQRMGLQVVVVGRDGLTYPPDRWWESNTFWQDEQKNLLVADNQTTRFAQGDADEKWRLARAAWGARACVGGTSSALPSGSAAQDDS